MKIKCDLCDKPAMHIHSRCHITAPVRAEIVGNKLSLYCYLPECNRYIATFTFEKSEIYEGNNETTIPIPIND